MGGDGVILHIHIRAMVGMSGVVHRVGGAGMDMSAERGEGALGQEGQ